MERSLGHDRVDRLALPRLEGEMVDARTATVVPSGADVR